jgi:MFS family permease
MVRSIQGLAHWAAASWIVVGLSAAPSTWLWQEAARRFGWRKTTVCAYLFQAGGLFLSVMADGPFGILLSAAAFGSTFMGITSLTMAEGARRGIAYQTKTAAILTSAYALGQIAGPLCAGWGAQISGNFRLPLILAGCCVLCGAILTQFDQAKCKLNELQKEVSPCRT